MRTRAASARALAAGSSNWAACSAILLSVASMPSVGLELSRLQGTRAIVIVVTDPCPIPPVKRDPVDDAEHWRGLHLVEALSARWGWRTLIKDGVLA